MSNPVPTVGRVVHYMLGEKDVEQIETNRGDGALGNRVEAGQTYPAIIVRVWGDQPTSCCNLQVLLDGDDTYWATSRSVGEGPFHFSWPVRS